MSLNNSCHVEGNVSHIDREPNPGGGIKYTIRLGVRIDDHDDPNFGKKGFVTVTAYGTDEYDPWVDLDRGDDCVIDGETSWEGGESEQELIDGEWKTVGGGNPVIVGIALRRPLGQR